MPLLHLADLADARLAVFSSMTDSELRDPKQLVGLARAIDEDAGCAPNATDKQNAGIACASSEPNAHGKNESDMLGSAARNSQPADPNRLSNGLFIAESKNVIERALAAGIQPFALLVEECWLNQSRELIDALLDRDPSLPAFVATRERMHSLTGFERTRGALAAFHRPALPRVEDLLQGARRVAVLEDITNFTNIGAIFRSAAALGIDAVLATPACHDPFYRRAARVSMGTVFQVPWTRIGSLPETGLAQLHAAGFKTAALALTDDSIPLQARKLQQCDKLALVLGTEGDGLAAQTIAQCDYTVKIPMDHGVDSLNVAAASAVAFWELRVNHRS